MDQRASIITLGVNDLKSSKAFYDALGWQAASHDEEIVAYNLQNMALALYPWEKLAEDATVPINPPGCSSITIAYNVETEAAVDEVLKEAKSAGGKIIKPGQKAFWGGYSGYFADIDGHLWEVAYNPFSPLGPNGEFQWGGVEH